LFILIGLFGSNNKVRASFYLFLYTLFQKRRALALLLNQCLKTKLRGSPKALVTKDNRETYYPARLMPRGMVTSLEISVMKWVIADLNQALPVKEQRVDGFSISHFNKSKLNSSRFYCMRDYIVRCTLVAGKPVLGRNTSLSHIQGIKRVFIHSNSISSNSITQMLTTQVKPYI